VVKKGSLNNFTRSFYNWKIVCFKKSNFIIELVLKMNRQLNYVEYNKKLTVFVLFVVGFFFFFFFFCSLILLHVRCLIGQLGITLAPLHNTQIRNITEVEQNTHVYCFHSNTRTVHLHTSFSI